MKKKMDLSFFSTFSKIVDDFLLSAHKSVGYLEEKKVAMRTKQ